MQVFLDANIYLEYFRENSKERLTPLKELVKLVEKEEVKLLLTSQTRNEYFRNRQHIAEKAREALVKQSKVKFISTALFDGSTKEFKEVRKKTDELGSAYKKLIKKYDTAVEKQKTDVDVLIHKLFELAETLKDNEEILQRAHMRYMKGNPPRKSDYSFGDAITWETLMEKADADNIIIVSRDTDFIEKKKGDAVLNTFLYVEWRMKSRKKKRATLFTSLAECVNHLNKKKPIKEEVVAKEKNLPITTGGFAQGVSIPSTKFNQGEVYINADLSHLNSNSPLVSIVSLCPFCENYTLCNNLGSGIFECSVCKSNFEPYLG